MAVIRRQSKPQREWPMLVEALAAELRSPKKGHPILVIEEPVRGVPRFQTTVVWARWADVPTEDRAGVILDAYEQALGAEKMLQVSLALGLTPTEAKRLGIK